MRQVIIYPGEDGYWVVECPSLPGCISQGKTKEEALINIKEAIELYGGITFGQATMKPDGGIERIEITMPDLYDQNQTARPFFSPSTSAASNRVKKGAVK